MKKPPLLSVQSREALALFATLLETARREHQMSQAELAERSGVAASHISHIEHGTANPTLEVLENLAEGLQTTVIELLTIEKPQELSNLS